uniref:Photosystem I assembly protein Ycf4 n=1 Tax=Strongyloides papillosus TaxID=174720 RepID=A0A0N5CIR2_STREA
MDFGRKLSWLIRSPLVISFDFRRVSSIKKDHGGQLGGWIKICGGILFLYGGNFIPVLEESHSCDRGILFLYGGNFIPVLEESHSCVRGISFIGGISFMCWRNPIPVLEESQSRGISFMFWRNLILVLEESYSCIGGILFLYWRNLIPLWEESYSCTPGIFFFQITRILRAFFLQKFRKIFTYFVGFFLRQCRKIFPAIEGSTSFPANCRKDFPVFFCDLSV